MGIDEDIIAREEFALRCRRAVNRDHKESCGGKRYTEKRRADGYTSVAEGVGTAWYQDDLGGASHLVLKVWAYWDEPRKRTLMHIHDVVYDPRTNFPVRSLENHYTGNQKFDDDVKRYKIKFGAWTPIGDAQKQTGKARSGLARSGRK